MHRNQFINQGVPSVWAVGTDVTTSICGTGAADDCVLRFDNVAINGAGIANNSTAAAGTVIGITRAGVYMVSLTYPATAGGAANYLAITVNATNAGRNSTPTMATVGMQAYADCISPAVHNSATKLQAVVTVTRATPVGIIRFIAADVANGTPNAADVTVAEVRFAIHLISNVL